MLFIFQQPLFSHRWFLSVHLWLHHFLCICGNCFICASVASSFSVHLWQCLVVAHQPQGVQVDEFHIHLFGVLRVNSAVYGL